MFEPWTSLQSLRPERILDDISVSLSAHRRDIAVFSAAQRAVRARRNTQISRAFSIAQSPSSAGWRVISTASRHAASRWSGSRDG